MMKKCLLLLALGLPLAAQAAPYEIGDLPACTSLTPAAISLDNDPVTLDVRVLLDGVSLQRGQDIMDRAADSYSNLGITVVNSYESVSLAGTEAQELIDQAKTYYGGQRPAGIDVVYVLTSKEFGTLAGLADCIGGVKYADRAFGVGEAGDDSPLNLLVYNLGTNMAAGTAAHEIGHLLGGHHHYANCVENALAIGGAPCSLMFNVGDFSSSGFSLLNGIVVRGHAQAYATP
ncbi:MAG: zinc-dependent metalloprotease family protein [Oceanococcaceae bacterium]